VRVAKVLGAGCSAPYAVTFGHAQVWAFREIPRTKADLCRALAVFHISKGGTGDWRNAAGGISRDPKHGKRPPYSAALASSSITRRSGKSLPENGEDGEDCIDDRGALVALQFAEGGTCPCTLHG